MYVTLKFFRKNDSFKSHGSPLFNAVVEIFVALFFLENLYFLEKNIIHQQQCAQM